MTIPFLNPDLVEDFSGTSSKYRQDISNKVFSLDGAPTTEAVSNRNMTNQFENRPEFMSIKNPLIMSLSGKFSSKVKGITITSFPVSG